MADDKISGSEYGLFIDTAGGTTYDVVVCLTDHSFKLATAVLDANSYCGPDKRPGTTSYETSFNGQVILAPSSGKAGLADLYTAAAAKSTVGWKIARLAGPATDDINWAGTGFVASLDISWATEDYAKFSSSIGVYGVPTFTVTP